MRSSEYLRSQPTNKRTRTPSVGRAEISRTHVWDESFAPSRILIRSFTINRVRRKLKRGHSSNAHLRCNLPTPGPRSPTISLATSEAIRKRGRCGRPGFRHASESCAKASPSFRKKPCCYSVRRSLTSLVHRTAGIDARSDLSPTPQTRTDQKHQEQNASTTPPPTQDSQGNLMHPYHYYGIASGGRTLQDHRHVNHLRTHPPKRFLTHS